MRPCPSRTVLEQQKADDPGTGVTDLVPGTPPKREETTMHQSPDTGRLNLSTQAEGATTLERLREHIRTLLVEFKDTYHRYVVMIATEKRARILEVNLGAVTKEIWAERPELRQRVGREWTRDQYQNHSRDRADRFIKEKVEILDRLMSQGGQTHLILAGSPPLAARPAQGPLSRAHVEPATASSPRARSRAAGAC